MTYIGTYTCNLCGVSGECMKAIIIDNYMYTGHYCDKCIKKIIKDLKMVNK